MHIHILGICGTFMAGVAVLARELGHRVSGSDVQAYPPMSDQLAAQGIEVHAGYDPAQLGPAPDLVLIGNALSRGNPAVEHVLAERLPYTSGPAWLGEQVLRGRRVLAVAGTHGKTTTSAMLAWLLERAGAAPGFLVGGVPENLGVSARLGSGACFVVEADEYDSAFFDKRSKFLHYRPDTLILNNLEYDHADIFPDLDAIKLQFHHLVRTVPRNGLIIRAAGDAHLGEVLAMGCWTPVETFGTRESWHARIAAPDASRFEVRLGERDAGRVEWPLMGRHNVDNALAAIAAAHRAGVPPRQACAALAGFRSVKRRMQVRARLDGITLYDDFAHHPTAIAATLDALRGRAGSARIIAILEPRSNTMRLGVHRDTLGPALAQADLVWLYRCGDLGWDPQAALAAFGERGRVCGEVDAIVAEVAAAARAGDHLLVMSNGAFGGIHAKLIDALRARDAAGHG